MNGLRIAGFSSLVWFLEWASGSPRWAYVNTDLLASGVSLYGTRGQGNTGVNLKLELEVYTKKIFYQSDLSFEIRSVQSPAPPDIGIISIKHSYRTIQEP